MLCNYKKPKFIFERINYMPCKKFNSFLQPRERYVYIFTGSTNYFNTLLQKHCIDYNMHINSNIYLCKYLITHLEFEVRVHNEQLEFILIVGNNTDFINLINIIKKID